MDTERFIEAGTGLSATGKFMAQVAVALDEYVIDQTGEDPARLAEVLFEVGLTKTARMLGYTGSGSGRSLWQESCPAPSL